MLSRLRESMVRLGASLRGSRPGDSERLREELAQHQAMLEAEGAGARAAALRLGGRDQIEESWRDQRGWPWLEDFFRDLRHGWRSLRRSPGFSVVVVLSLALGIGANGAIFSLAYGILWKPLPYPDSGRIVSLQQSEGGRLAMKNSSLDITEARPWALGFSAWAMYRPLGATLTGSGVAEALVGVQAEAQALQILGVRPVLGRMLAPADNAPGAPPVVMISDALWHSRFGGRPNVIGQPIRLDRRPYTVIGVLPRWFTFPSEGGYQISFWRAWQEKPEGAGNRDVDSIARLAPGITKAQVQARLETAMKRLAASHPADKGWSFTVESLRRSVVGDTTPEMWMMLTAVTLVWLIASANVAGLLRGRTLRRQRELATRAALGAGRGRIARQLATEAALLFAAGTGLGLAVVEAGIRWLQAAAPAGLPRLDQVGLNGAVVAYLLGAGLLAALTFGVLPAFFVSGREVDPALRVSFAISTRAQQRGRRAWVVAQVALALLLLVGSGLLLSALFRMTAVPLGFNPDRVLRFYVTLPTAGYRSPASRLHLYESLATRLQALPGVDRASIANEMPLNGSMSTGFTLPGQPAQAADSQITHVNAVLPAFFRTLQIPIQRGRGLHSSDTAAAPPVIVVSQAFAQQVFRGRNPLGQRVQLNWGPKGWATVVGIAGDARTGLGDRPRSPKPAVYFSMAQGSFVPYSVMVAIRAAGNPDSLLAPARRVLASLDPDLPVIDAATVARDYADQVAAPRFRGDLVGGFAALALLLTLIGVYGVLAYSVAARTQEFGVRVALGAHPRQVVGLVLGEAIKLLAAGLAVGTAAALLTTRALASLLYGVSPTSPWVLGGAILMLAASGVAAAWLPARRAARVDPALTLRAE